jgi:hypothetical protein
MVLPPQTNIISQTQMRFNKPEIFWHNLPLNAKFGKFGHSLP